MAAEQKKEVTELEAVYIHDGYFVTKAGPVYPVGVNYWPSLTGTQMWQQWCAADIKRDLTKLKQAGYNTVRFFLIWPDFEPNPGEYNAQALAQLDTFIETGAEVGIYLMPTIFQGWMSGESYDVSWRQGRNLYADPFMLERQEAMCYMLAERYRGQTAIIAFDLANEIACYGGGSTEQWRPQVYNWQKRLAAAIRQADPQRLVVNGTDTTTVLARSDSFNLGDQAQIFDFLSMHGYPMFQPFPLESLSGLRSTYYVPFLVSVARAFGPVMLQEFGYSDLVVSAQRIGDYYQAVLASAMLAGANGALAWCYQDIACAQQPPYNHDPKELRFGIFDLAGQAKPAAMAMQHFAQWVRDAGKISKPAGRVGILIQPQFFQRKDQLAHIIYASFIQSRRAHLDSEFIWDWDQLNKYPVILLPGVVHGLTDVEYQKLISYVESGGTLYYSMGHPFVITPGLTKLFGVTADDGGCISNMVTLVSCDGGAGLGTISFTTNEQRYTKFSLHTDTQLLATGNGMQLTVHFYGQGKAIFTNWAWEQSYYRPGAMDGGEHGYRIYELVANLAGLAPVALCNNPNVEVGWLDTSKGRQLVAVNHTGQPVTVTINGVQLELAIGAWATVNSVINSNGKAG